MTRLVTLVMAVVMAAAVAACGSGNPLAGGGSWVEQHALLMAVVWPILITAVFLPLAVRSYQRLSR